MTLDFPGHVNLTRRLRTESSGPSFIKGNENNGYNNDVNPHERNKDLNYRPLNF